MWDRAPSIWIAVLLLSGASPAQVLGERLRGVVVGKQGKNVYEVALWTYGDSGYCGTGGHPRPCRPEIVLGEHVLVKTRRLYEENEDMMLCVDPSKTKRLKLKTRNGFEKWIKRYTDSEKRS